MNYPLISEYISSILSAEDNFEQLNYLRPVLNEDGSPVMTSGNFAVVFKMQDSRNGKFHAVKCFTKEQQGRAEAYKLIAEELDSRYYEYYCIHGYLIKIQYLESELFVDSKQTDETEFPVLLMDWVEGETLDKYVRKYSFNKYEMEMITNGVKGMVQWLLSQPFAHGDLKPDNILVREGGSLVLVDYDGMYVQAMKGQKARELGSPDFRHPNRTEDDFDEHIDDFPAVSILLSLEAITYNPEWLSYYGAIGRLLLSEKDYLNYGNSELVKILTLTDNAIIHKLLNVFYFVLGSGSLSGLSPDFLKLPHPNVRQCYYDEMLFTKVTKEDLANGIRDEFGCLFSRDGKRLLEGNEDLISYTIPEGTFVVCDHAFSCDSKLQHIQFPRSLTHIGNMSFYECGALKKIEIQSQLYFIGSYAFANCRKLKKLSFEDVFYIGDAAFQNCITLDYISIEYVKHIGNAAFRNCQKLNRCDFWSIGIEYVGEKSFYGCEELISVGDLYDYNDSKSLDIFIGNSAFEGCMRLNSIISFETRMTHIGSYNCLERVRYIGDRAFKNCKSLEEVSLSGVKYIADCAFEGCESLTYIFINEDIDYIGYGAFDECRLFQPFDDDDHDNYVKFHSYSDAYIYEKYSPTISCDAPHLLLLSKDAKIVRLCISNKKRVVLPSIIEKIGFRAFAECKELKEIVLPDSVRVVERGAFLNCKELYSINIPDGVTKIENCAFARCESLQSMDLPEGIDRIEQSVFEGCVNLSYICIPQSVKKIDKKAFASCENLDTVELYEGLEIIDDYAFYGCENLESIDFPEGISSIGDCAFEGCKALSELELPNSVKKIGNDVFRCCREIQTIVLPEFIKTIPSGAFAGCWSLELINIPTSVHTLGTWVEESGNGWGDRFLLEGAFEWCVKLKAIKIPNNVKRIGTNSFANCRNLVSVEIEEGVEELWDSAFENCSGLQSIVIPRSVFRIEDKVFKGCKQLTSVVIPEGVRAIGESLFEECDLQTIALPKSVKYIQRGAFAKNENLHIVDLPKSVEEVGCFLTDSYNATGAFQSCKGITSLYIPGNVKRIGNNTFKDCENLCSVVIEEGVMTIGYGVFSGCVALKSISIPSSIDNIGSGTFNNCNQLKEIIIPDGERERLKAFLPEELHEFIVEK